MLETKQYTRKPFNIQAAQVGPDNIEEVAKWVNGKILTDDVGQHIKVKVHRPANDRQTKAYHGDWVLFAGTGFKVYNDKAFKNSFEQLSGESIMVDVAAASKAVDNDSAKDEIVGVVEGDVVVPKRVSKTKTKTNA